MATPDREALLAALEWQLELGADEAIADAPIDRYALFAAEAEAARAPGRSGGAPGGPAGPAAAGPAHGSPGPAHGSPGSASPAPAGSASAGAASVGPASARRSPARTGPGDADPASEAQAAAEAAGSLEDLRAALAAFEHCELKLGARSLVFADGRPGARTMIVGEAPGREEDQQGKPFVGRAGRLLDAMFACIGLSREHPDAGRALYITNILPWRPPQNREPTAEEMAMMTPFVVRHVELADPDVLVLMGNASCHALLGRRGITRLRGGWTETLGKPCLPMFHPAYLLRNPGAKREAWADLLALQARLRAQDAQAG